MPIGKTFEISLEVDGGEASLAGVKIYGYSHTDDAAVGKSASLRNDQFKGTLYTAKVAYPAGQVPGDATNLGDLVAVAKAAIVDVFGEVFAEPKVEAPVVAPAVETKAVRGGRGKKAEAPVVEAAPQPAEEAKAEAPQADYPGFVEGAGAGEAEVIVEAEELQTGDK